MTVAGPPETLETQDHWLDSVGTSEQRTRHPVIALIQESFGQPIQAVQKTVSFLSTSPGLMTAMSAIIAVAILAAGWSMSSSSNDRQVALQELLNNTEPMSYSAHNLYTSLSVADTMATTGFAQAEEESSRSRARYNDAIQKATLAATETAAGVSDVNTRELALIAQIQQQLPVYTGLVEVARTNNRSGNPVGAAYLAEASALMREQILPAAGELFSLTTQAVTDQQDRFTKPQWIPLSGLAAALVLLGAGQYWLTLRTNRRFNKGFVYATAFMLTALLWVSMANWATWHAGRKGFEEASAPLGSLANSRIVAQQARTEETLALIRRQDLEGWNNSFNGSMHRIESALDSYSALPIASSEANQQSTEVTHGAIEKWKEHHSELSELQRVGNYEDAMKVALGPGDDAFSEFDSSMASLISDARSGLRSYIMDALVATRLVSSAVLTLSWLAVIAVALGIRPRLQEYL